MPKPKTILLADDSVTIRRVVELTFTGTDVRVETAASGREALDRMETVRPDLVLADVAMPEPDGYELCRRVKESDQSVPVLLLAGAFEPFDAGRARTCGADGHLVKPFESSALVERVQALLEPPTEAPSPPGSPEDETVEEVLDELSAPLEGGQEKRENAPEPEASETPDGGSRSSLLPEEMDAVVEAVVRRLSDRVLREIAWEVIPDLAEVIIKERIRELEQERD